MKKNKHIEVGTIGHIDHSISPNIQLVPIPEKPVSLWDRVGIEIKHLAILTPKNANTVWVASSLNELQEAYHKPISLNIVDVTNMLKRKPETITFGFTVEYTIHDADNPPQNVEIITKQRALHVQATAPISSPIYVSFYLCKPETSQKMHQYTVAYCIGGDENLYIFSSDEWAKEFGEYRKEFNI